MNTDKHGGRLFVISAPSGAGKTSLVRALLQRRPELALSISHTTRPRRPNEVDGRDYYFVDRAQFEQLRAQSAFLESAQVFDNFYGTGATQVRERLAGGRDVLLEIDWQGARQVRAAMPECVSIFILPPSHAELETRLRARGTDSDAVIARRLAEAESDMSHYQEFDFVLVNEDFEQALSELDAIVRGQGEALRVDRPGLAEYVQRLLR